MTNPITPPATNFATARDAAKFYVDLGWEPVVLRPRDKKPDGKWGDPTAWTDQIIDTRFAEDSNIGIALRERSSDLIDIDFDCPEAARLAEVILGDLPSFGRATSPKSHRVADAKLKKGKLIYQLPADMAAAIGAERAMLLELRGKGHQTMFPPSVHPNGETVAWHDDLSTIPNIDGDELTRKCGLVAALAVIAMRYPKVAGERDEVAMMLAGALVRCGLADEEIDELTVAVATIAGDEEAEKRCGKAKASREKIQEGEPVWGLPELCARLGIESIESKLRKWLGLGATAASGVKSNLPQIVVTPGNLPDAVDQAEDAMIEAGVGVYQRGELLVRVTTLPKSVGEDGVARPGGALVLTRVNSTWLREQFARIANWFNLRKGKLTPTNPPTDHASTYIARIGDWRVPVLNGVISTPTLRADGSILQRPGFDLESGLLYDPRGVEYPPILEQPDLAEAEAALLKLRRPFREFKFAEPADESVYLAALLTALIRRALPTAPIFAIDAPTAGTGKSLLAETIGVIATGRAPTMISQGKSNEEDEKRLSSVLMAGDGIVVIDNCDRPLGGDALCTVLTTEVWTARILGKSQVARTPTNALFMATGNNLEIAGDLTRRTLICRMDTGAERADLIPHGFDPREEAESNRPELVVAGLTLLRAYIAADRPKLSQPMGSFNVWNLVRDALIWLDEADPADTRERVMADDPKKGELATLLELWVSMFGDAPFTVAEIGKLTDGGPTPTHNDLYAALVALCRDGRFNAKSIGRRLAKFKDRVVGGKALRTFDGSDGVKRYRVETISTVEVAAPRLLDDDIPF